MKDNLRNIISIVLILFSTTLQVSAPVRKSLIILNSIPAKPYIKLIHAIGIVETKCDTMAYNPVENAVGYFQIRPIRLEDYNKKTGSNYKMRDLYNYEISEKIFIYYADRIGPYNLERIARKWNGSGPRTIYYWNKIKKYI